MKILTISLVLGFCLVTINGKVLDVQKKTSGSRILGGSPAAEGQFPWQVLNYVEFPKNSISFSGSTLISSTRLLTAAHNWFDGINYGIKMTVHLGSNEMGGGLEIVASDVVIHEEYDSLAIRNDIGIVYLPYAVEFNDFIKPAVLPFGPDVNDDFVDADAVTSGFGDTGFGVTGSLNFVDLKVISNQQCSQELGIVGMFVQPSNICTSGKGYVGICSGDSGGPLVVYRDDNAVLIGIPSFGLSACYVDSPSVYTRVTSYKSWVESKL